MYFLCIWSHPTWMTNKQKQKSHTVVRVSKRSWIVKHATDRVFKISIASREDDLHSERAPMTPFDWCIQYVWTRFEVIAGVPRPFPAHIECRRRSRGTDTSSYSSYIAITMKETGNPAQSDIIIVQFYIGYAGGIFLVYYFLQFNNMDTYDRVSQLLYVIHVQFSIIWIRVAVIR